LIKPLPTSILFPSTTLFRSVRQAQRQHQANLDFVIFDDDRNLSRPPHEQDCHLGIVDDRRRIGAADRPQIADREGAAAEVVDAEDRKSTRLNSSHVKISYAV